MTAVPAPTLPYAFTVTAWRDHDEAANELPGMRLDPQDIDGRGDDAARRLFEAGARRVVLPRPVDLTDETDAAWAVRALSFVGDLTSLAIAVDWQVRFAAGSDAWIPLSHLHPPKAVLGVPDPDGTLRRWRDGYYICKCIYRQGPGFVQVRDRRRGELRRFTIDEPEYRAAIELLADGAPAVDVPTAITDDFLQEELAARIGEFLWWMPYRVRRWSQAPRVI
ncbi:hypothetical protein AQJ66_24195 [Streptomyces bungoensis]|uniref:Uncharacterized protein n=1 Tax=Streptomyces bungoensis TaxID=285568 RepID=A0A101SWM6_9ACTN|nr:DUF5825 family protein [Streptomyces bungoensis]KUN81502.1 hypothetical protein AQJ66_24195 [Streptomyces bungoensis]